MRILASALIALAALSWSVPPAEARSRTQQAQAQARPAATQTTRAAATRRAEVPQRQARATQPATRHARAAQPGGGQAAARSTGRDQQASAGCGRGGRCAPRQVSWQAGLAPATNAQAQACPAGTLATLARGHSDVVRCVPL